MEIMSDDLQCEILELLNKKGMIPEMVVRDAKIKRDYIKLRRQGVNGKDAREMLSDKYTTGIKNIEKILYGKKC